MEIIRGKQTSFIDPSLLAERRDGYTAVHLDLGTGDGRFVLHTAQMNPHSLVIGVDACRENLREASRRTPANALFVIANARALPIELETFADSMTINFPWGSLLQGLLDNDAALMATLRAVLRANARLEVRLNGGALHEAGWQLEDGAQRVRDTLVRNGFTLHQTLPLRAHDLRACPTTWAKRLAFGRDPRAMYLAAKRDRSGTK